VFYVKIEKCFPFLVKRKTLSYDENNFFLLTKINFSLTSFPYGYQTLKNKENEFQEFVFLKTNKALVCRDFARNCRCWVKLLSSASLLLLVLSFSILVVSVSHVLPLLSLSYFFSCSLSLLFSPLLCVLWSSFLFLFSPGSFPFLTVSPSSFVAFPYQSRSPPSPLYSVFFVRIRSSLLFFPYYPFLLLLCGLSLAFIKPENAMQSPRQ